jgi:hypothetical protein
MRHTFGIGLRVLAIRPTSRGFGFAVLEGAELLIDWGTKDARCEKNARSLGYVEALLDEYQPDAIVVEDARDRSFRRCARVRDLLQGIRRMAFTQGVRVRSISKRRIREVFSETRAVTKHDLALAIAGRLPELAPRLPPRRKPWMSQDERMSIFDAVGLGLALFEDAA